MSDIPVLKLNNGVTMPQFGLGVWRIAADEAAGIVRSAIENDYRLIDTAAIYNNEEGVGEGIRQSGVPRSELFVTSKVWNDDQGYDQTLKAFDASLERLKLDYLDLYLIHWPAPVQDKYVETWKALEHLYKEGRIKAIGVSNFQPSHLERLAEEGEVVPAVNQVELHPLMSQPEVRAYDEKHGIVTEAWSPLRGVLGDETPGVLQDLADKHRRSVAQIVLRWHIQLGVVVIPRSSKPERLKENRSIFDFELSDEEMKLVSGLDSGRRIGPHPDAKD